MYFFSLDVKKCNLVPVKNKSYQTVESGSSTVVTKVKGIGYINNSLSRFSSSIIQNQGLYKVFDTSSKFD